MRIADLNIIGASMSEPHTDEICMCVSLKQISLTPIATLYDNGFSGRVQNSSRAFNYPRSALWPVHALDSIWD